tara:strand:- start:11781 stop:12125 length:345 start_codon:yes stop_codon:yes gene_type:complete
MNFRPFTPCLLLVLCCAPLQGQWYDEPNTASQSTKQTQEASNNRNAQQYQSTNDLPAVMPPQPLQLTEEQLQRKSKRAQEREEEAKRKRGEPYRNMPPAEARAWAENYMSNRKQ